MATQTLDRILQSQGFGSRKECRARIQRGEVRVASELVRDFRQSFELEGLEIKIDDKVWCCHKLLYLALNKPAGYECSRNPTHHQSVFTLVPSPFINRGVQPIGRLDQDTCGLLLFSDDGAFNHAISSPKRHVHKTYLAEIQDEVTPQIVTQLCEGVLLNNETATVSAITCEQTGLHQLELTIDQGKYHQVKRMLAVVGTICVSLQRIAIGSLKLNTLSLDEGAWCQLTSSQLAQLHSK